jgi:hypothetical protein
MLVLLGAWVALIGYGVLYAGVNKLGGGACGLRQAFSTTGCQAGSGTQGASFQGSTAADRQAALDQQQQATIPGTVLV